MFALVLAVALVATGFVLLRLKDHPKRLSRFAVVPFGLAAVVVASSCVFRLDAGEAAVTKTFGTVGDQAIHATGIHLKAPWQDLIRFDIRNQTISLDEGTGRVSTVTTDNAPSRTTSPSATRSIPASCPRSSGSIPTRSRSSAGPCFRASRR